MILRLSHRSYCLPFRTPINTAHGPWAEREGLLLRVESEGGGVGYGEVAPIPWFGSCTVSEAEAYIKALEGRFRPDVSADLPVSLSCVRGALEAAAEAALQDEARRQGRPDPYASDAELVAPGLSSATPSAAPVMRKHMQVAGLLPAGRAALERARERVDLGFRCLKWKVGVGDIADELALLDDLLAVLPEGARLRLDANGAWDRRRAERWLERCAERPIEFVEQPIAADARGAEDLLLGLAGDFPTPLALDESIVGDADVEHWLELGWNGVYVLKPSLLGNVRARMARLSQVKAAVVFSSALETRVGAARLLRLAFEWAGESRPLGMGVWPLFSDPRFDGPTAAPFVTMEDLKHLNPEEPWNALS